MKDLQIQPNFSSLQREFGTDRHTIKKYYEQGGIPERKSRIYKKMWDPFLNELDDLLKMPQVTYRAAWLFLAHKYGEEKLPGNYSSMRNYLYQIGKRAKAQNQPHLLYETPPAKQAQFDWKEDLLIHLSNGQEIKFHVFSLTLSYSREHIFIYSPHKGTDDLIHCFIKAINRIGGTCEVYLTDNMSAIVSIHGANKKIDSRVSSLFKDLGAELKLCKIRTPQTKGKDENANKFINWIYPYDYKLNSEEELIDLIENTITADANRQVNSGTNLPPMILFSKEKEYLKPLANKILLDSYLNGHTKQIVPATQLVYYQGKKYSVGSEYVSKCVDLYPISDRLYLYHHSKLIAIHTISQNKINYSKKHYLEGLSKNLPDKKADEIEKMANENIQRLKGLGKEDENGKD